MGPHLGGTGERIVDVAFCLPGLVLRQRYSCPGQLRLHREPARRGRHILVGEATRCRQITTGQRDLGSGLGSGGREPGPPVQPLAGSVAGIGCRVDIPTRQRREGQRRIHDTFHVPAKLGGAVERLERDGAALVAPSAESQHMAEA